MKEKKLTMNNALNLALKNHSKGKLNEAELIYRKILDKDPYNPDALHLLGLIAHQTGKYEDAVKYISKAIKSKSDAVYHGNLAMTYDALGKEEESAKNYKIALKINPAYGNAHLAHYNLGVFFRDKGNIIEALEHLNKAIDLDKNFSDAHWNKSLILLLLGRFKEGWREYEYRFKKKEPTDSRIFYKPKWDGSLLKDKKILIISEQGFGDNIQFSRYIPLVKDKGAYIILECKKELRKLFKDSFDIDKFVEKESSIVPDVDFDFYIHLMDLPRIFNTDLHNIPNKTPYLKANSKLVEKFGRKISNDNFKIGIAWAGNPNQDNDNNRSTTFNRFKILKEIPEINLLSLQKGEASHQLDDTGIFDLSKDINDFADTAAIIENLDLVISVDTSVAHLSGALGKPTWILLSFIPDWRWLLGRNDNPWYPSMKLFRQLKSGDWDFLFSEVNKELRNHLKRKIYK